VALIVETSLISGREILRGIARYAREHEPWSVYHEPRSLEASVPRWLKVWRGDGIIARLQTEQIATAVIGTGLPAVDVLGMVPSATTPLVHVDDTAIGQMAADDLLGRGYREFGYCGLRGANWSEKRERAFRAAVVDAGCRCVEYRLSPHSRSESSWEAQQVRLATWVSRLPKPAGVLACYDPVGQRVLEACRRVDAIVPDQVAVLGVDNDQTICDVCDPPLSSIAANHARVGYEAAALLDRMMRRRRRRKRPIYVDPLGVVTRASTDILAVGDEDVAAALRLIHERACGTLRVGDVVEHVMISRSVLKERFRRLLGHSIHDEIVKVRIRAVKRLLAETDLPLSAVAREAGFRHPEYMGVVFRKLVGKTPGQFRKETHPTGRKLSDTCP
jgi:LacI family transcriptional regulator